MILKTLFLLPEEFDDTVTLVDAIDEYAWDAGSNWAADDMQSTRERFGEGRYVEVDINIDDDELAKALAVATLTSVSLGKVTPR